MSNLTPRNPAWWLTHQKTGCNLHPDCLTCPLPRCQFDDPPGREEAFKRQKRRTRARHAAIRDAALNRSKEYAAQLFEVSEATVRRALKGA